MLSVEEQILINDYFSHQLSENVRSLFVEKLLENNGNNPFARALKLQNTVAQIIEQNPVMKARIIVEKLGLNQIEHEKTSTFSNVLSSEEVTYTLEELSQMFAPIAGYEEVVFTRSYTGGAVENKLQEIIVLPESGIDCNDSLFFAFGEPVNSSLLLGIYDNSQHGVLKKEIPPLELMFDLKFTLPPGRYYWKLTPTDRNLRRQLGIATGILFVHSHLMPPN